MNSELNESSLAVLKLAAKSILNGYCAVYSAESTDELHGKILMYREKLLDDRRMLHNKHPARAAIAGEKITERLGEVDAWLEVAEHLGTQ